MLTSLEVELSSLSGAIGCVPGRWAVVDRRQDVFSGSKMGEELVFSAKSVTLFFLPKPRTCPNPYSTTRFQYEPI